MRGRQIGAALALLGASGAWTAQVHADDTTTTTTTASSDDEIEASRRTLAESESSAPALERGTPPKKPSVWPWIIGGVGAAAAVTGGVFVLVSLGDTSQADDFSALAANRPNPNEKAQLESAAQESSDSADSNMTIGLVAGGAGLGLLVVAVVWAIVDSPGDSASPSQVTARITPGGVAMTF